MLKIFFGDLQIGSIKNTSGLFAGDNFQLKWEAEQQSYQGYGLVSGNCNYLSQVRGTIVKSPRVDNSQEDRY